MFICLLEDWALAQDLLHRLNLAAAVASTTVGVGASTPVRSLAMQLEAGEAHWQNELLPYLCRAAGDDGSHPCGAGGGELVVPGQWRDGIGFEETQAHPLPPWHVQITLRFTDVHCMTCNQ